MPIRFDARPAAIVFVVLLLAAAPLLADKKPQPLPKGDLATSIREAPLYVSPSDSAQKLVTVTPGREMVIAERSGEWLRVFANTDVEQEQLADQPEFGAEGAPPPISGWMLDRGIVRSTTPGGDLVLFGVAASAEEEAMDSNGPRRAAQDARLLYRRVALIFPQSPKAAEAAWRSADIRWQVQKAEVMSRPSAHEKENWLREQIDDTEMKKIQKLYPGSKWADLAAYDQLDNKVCGDWQGSTKCPEKETDLYLKYVDEHPASPKAPQALYKAVWRLASLGDMYTADGDEKRAAEARARGKAVAARLSEKYGESDYAARAAGLVYKMEQNIPVYGSDRD